jgi:uncharacterized coiled-coil DUF342 family protein
MADEAKTPETTEAAADGADAADAAKQEEAERISKPSKEELDKRIEIIEEEIKNWQAKQNALHEKRKESMGGGPKTGPLADARAKFRELSTEARGLREERKGYFDQLGAMRAAREKMQAQLKAMRDQMGPMKSVEDMDKKIRQMEQKQSTTSMTLSQEKELVKEIETLKSMRKEAGKFEQARSKADKGKDDGAKGDISSKLDESKEKLAALNAQMDEQKKVLEKLQQQDKSQQTRAQIPAILRELDACSAEIDGCFTRIRALRADFREKNNQWFEYSKVLRAQRAEQRAKEAEERRKAWEEKQAEIEAEEAKKVPWEEEMALCNYLITDYLSKLMGGDGAAPKVEEAATPELDGLQPMRREQETFMVLPGAKKKKFGKKKKRATLTHSVDTVETFGVIGLTPPISMDAVPASIDAVKAKLEEYKVKPREPKKKKEQKPKPAEGEEGEAPVEKPKPKKKAPAKKYEHDSEAFPSLGGK